MLPSKLIHIIEDHCEQITTRVLRGIRQDPKLERLQSLPESELRERARDILKNLGHWLAAAHEDELAARFEKLGHTRCTEGIPLCEMVRGQLLIKRTMLSFVREQGLGQNPVDLYAEEELEHCVGRFFDTLVYFAIRGYEAARQAEPRPRTAAARR